MVVDREGTDGRVVAIDVREASCLRIINGVAHPDIAFPCDLLMMFGFVERLVDNEIMRSYEKL